MARDSNLYKIDPTIVKMNNDGLSTNYGHALSQAFTDLGTIENNKIKLKAEDTKNQYEEIKLQNIRDELDDDRSFSTGMLSDNPQEYFKNNKMRTSKYQLMGEEYKNNLSLKEQDSHYKSALANFTDETGNFNIKGAKENLMQKYKDGIIDEKTLYDLNDTLAQKTGTGIYTKKLTAQDQLDMMKTQSEIYKNNAQINKYNAETRNVGSESYAPTTLKKEYLDYANSMKNVGLEPQSYHEFIDDKNANKNMGMGLKDMKNASNSLSQAMQKGDILEINHALSNYQKVFNNDIKLVDKYFRDLAPVAYSFEQAKKVIDEKGAGIADNVLNNFAEWTGIGWDDTTQQGRVAAIGLVQPMIKAINTGTASNQDMNQFMKSWVDLNKSDKAAANAFRYQLGQIVAKSKHFNDSHILYSQGRGYDKQFETLNNMYNALNEADSENGVTFKSVTGATVPKGQPISSTMNNQNPPPKNTNSTTIINSPESLDEFLGN